MLLLIRSLEALLGRNVGDVIEYLVARLEALSLRNMGEYSAYLVARGTTWNVYELLNIRSPEALLGRYVSDFIAYSVPNYRMRASKTNVSKIPN